jgi:hypothetical protein
MKRLVSILAVGAVGAAAQATVFPTTPHAANNFIPFGANQTITMHQVFASSLFSNATGGLPALITGIGFSPDRNGTYNSSLTVNLGYTTRTPGVASGAGGLSIPTAGGGGGPNALGAMTTFFQNPTYSITIAASTTNGTNFSEMVLGGSFVYNPALGNLLVEIVSSAGATLDLAVSRTSGSAESSRAYSSTRFASTESPTTATRMDFTFQAVPEPGTMIALGAGLAAIAARRRRRS